MTYRYRRPSSGPSAGAREREATTKAREVERPSKSQDQRHRWSNARRFQDSVHEVLSAEGVCFMEWFLLETVQELIGERDDLVSQADVARRAGLSERVVSYWMLRMNEQGAVDRAPAADGRAWRVVLTPGGERLRRECNQRLEARKLTG